MARRLEKLHRKRQREGLTRDEGIALSELVRKYERAMLIRAQAAALLKRRGYDVSKLAGADTNYQPPDPSAPPAAQPKPDGDPARVDPLEPDFSLVNLPTTLRLPVHGGDNEFFHARTPGGRQTVIGHRATTFVPAFLQNAQRRNVRHHVIRITCDPCPPRGQILLQPQRIIHHDLTAKGNER